MKKANPKAVGGFVLGAVVLAVGAVIVFGSGRIFEDRHKMVAFFPGSLMGLRLGASVEMRGIQIGTVTDLWVEYDPESRTFTLPVVMNIDLSRIRERGGTTVDAEQDSDLDELIARGFRAQLVAQSLVTGQQSIQFGFHPDTPVKLVETSLPYEQVPTIPSSFETVQSSIEDLTKEAGVVLAKVSDLLSTENRARVASTLDNVETLTTQMISIVEEFGPVIVNLRSFTSALKDDTPEIKKLRLTAQQTLESYKALADSADRILTKNEKGIEDFANTGLYEITNLAVDMQATAEQIRRVMEEMERDPARFFLGRPREVEVQ